MDSDMAPNGSSGWDLSMAPDVGTDHSQEAIPLYL